LAKDLGDASVPGALTAGDLCDLAGSLAPRLLHFGGMVDHLNRPLTGDAVRTAYPPAVQGYAAAPQALTFSDEKSSAAAWLLKQLR